MPQHLYEIAPSFELAAQRWPDALNLQQHYNDLKTTYESEGSSVIELTKSFLEMVCHTVLEDLGAQKPDRDNPTTTQLFSCVKDALGLRNVRESNGLGEILSGYHKLINGLVTLRNGGGSVAHGKDSYFDSLTARHVKIFLLAAESVISFILEAFDGIEPNLNVTREPYERFSHLNNKIDQATRTEAEVDEITGSLKMTIFYGPKDHRNEFDLNFNISEILYKLDRTAYVETLNYIKGVELKHKDDIVDAEFEPTSTDTVIIDREFKTVPELDLKNSYNGKLSSYAPSFRTYIKTIDATKNSKTKLTQLINSTLSEVEKFVVIDWKKRENVKSEIRLSLKKIIRKLKIKNISTAQLMEWLLENIEEPQ